MQTNLNMKYLHCGYWNRVPVNKIFIEQNRSEPNVRVMIPVYEPLEVSKCEKSGKLKAQPKELIRMVKTVNVSRNPSETKMPLL